VAPCILAANNYYYHRGGSEAVFFSESAQLKLRGWQVVPFSMHHPQNIPSEWEAHFADKLELGEIRSVVARLVAAPKSIYSFEAKSKISRLIELARPDICHLHNIYHHLSPAILPAVKAAGIPTVMTLHDLKIACPAYTMLAHDGICERCKGGRYRNVIRHKCVNGSILQSGLVYLEARLHAALRSYTANVDRFIVPSNFYRDKFIEWGTSAESLIYIPNAIDISQYQSRRCAGDYFVYVGRLVEEKGIELLIHAANRAKVPLKIVGTGPLKMSLESVALSLGAEVEFLGHLSGNTLEDVIANARSMVLPSTWYENAPISVLEAYALGTPVIGSSIGGIPELVESETTGLLFVPGDKEDLAEKLQTMAALSDDRVIDMGCRARERVEAEFDQHLHIERLLRVYRDLGVG